jgi:hypothetical protein
MKIKELSIGVPDNFTGIAECCDGADHISDIQIAYFKNQMLHRIDGPAVEHPNGVKLWYLNGARLFSKKYWESEVEKLMKSKIISK